MIQYIGEMTEELSKMSLFESDKAINDEEKKRLEAEYED
jgi:hypothetical protein